MPILNLPDKARQDPLGAHFYNWLLRNAAELQRMILRGHTADGAHNDLEVPRIIGGITNTAGTASVTAGSQGIASVAGFTAGGATGVATITLTAGLLGSEDGGATYPANIDVMVTDAAGETLPFLWSAEAVSSTQVKVRLFKLASLAGNTWNLTDATFNIAIYSPRHADTSTQLTAIADATYGNGLRVSKWNQLVTNLATQYTKMLVGHKTTGVHNVPHVARGWLKVTWSGAAFSITDDLNITSVSNPGAGRCGITHAVGPFANPLWVFGRPGATSSSPETQYLITCPGFAVSGMNVYCWKYDSGANTWSASECDFDLFIHSAAV